MWETVGQGLLNFGKSSLGQAAIGAGLGYGVDRLSGGKGGIGALAGGALGGLNALSSTGGLMGADNFTGSMADQAVAGMGGLLGGTKKAGSYTGLDGSVVNLNPDQLASVQSGSYVPGVANLTTSHMPTELFNQALPQSYGNAGLMGGLSNMQSKYGDLAKLGMDSVNAYGSYKSGQSERDLNQAEIDYANSVRLNNQRVADQAYANQQSTQANVDTGFSRSAMGRPTSYYSA